MAHLWLKDEANQWSPVPLDHDAVTLNGGAVQHFRQDDRRSSNVLVRTSGPHGFSWVLIAGEKSNVSINGMRLLTGIRVVSDRDEIRIANADTMYFSTETLAAISDFPGADQPFFCPRCKQEIKRDTAAVQCPGCSVWHHQSGELKCWTYMEACAMCAHPTDMEAGFRWTPEEL